MLAVGGVAYLEIRLPRTSYEELPSRPETHRPLDWRRFDRGQFDLALEVDDLPSEHLVTLPPGTAVRPRSLRIQGPARSLWLDTDHSVDFHSIHTMLEEVAPGTQRERFRAEAIWKLVMASTVHGPRPFEAALGNFSPYRHLLVYGYAACGNATSTLAYLWGRAGLKARTWALSGHVVPEVFYDGRWHLYDADERRAFRDPESGEIAGVADLLAHPEILRAGLDRHGRGERGETFETLRRIYLTRPRLDDFYRVKDAPLEGEDLARVVRSPAYLADLYRSLRLHWRPPADSGEIDLRDGEELMLFWEGDPRRFGLLAPESRLEPPPAGPPPVPRVPPVHANGAFRFRPRSVDGLAADGVEFAGEPPTLRLAEGRTQGYLEWLFRSPFLITNATLSGQRADGRQDGVEVKIRVAEGEWETASAPSRGHFLVDLAAVNSTDRPQALYAFDIRLTLRRSAAVEESPLIRDLELQTDVQVNPGALPVLRPGTNRVFLRGSPGKRPARITFRWDAAGPLPSRAEEEHDDPSAGSCLDFDPDLLGGETVGTASGISSLEMANLLPKRESGYEFLGIAEHGQLAYLEVEGKVPPGITRLDVTTRVQAESPHQAVRLLVREEPTQPWNPVWLKGSSPYPELPPHDTVDVAPWLTPAGSLRLRWEIESDLPLDRPLRLVGIRIRGTCAATVAGASPGARR